jgi:ribosomal protein S18 acetylase RimI-like enzyme
MKIVELTKELEPVFWNHVSRDPLDYYFFILDLKRWKEKTRVFLALEKREICGLMLVYNDEMVQLRGEPESFPELLERLGNHKVQITASMNSRRRLLAKYPKPALQETLMLMRLEKPNRKIKKLRIIKDLKPSDSAEIASLMHQTNPIWWCDITSTDVRNSFEDSFWVGIRRDGRLVSIGEARNLEVGGHVVIAATDEPFRNKGYATSIVSTLVKRLLKTAEVVLIFVLETNTAAVHSYEKVGFKSYRSYFVLRAQ